MDSIWPWVIFNLFIVGMLALDLGVFHREAKAVSIKEAAGWSVFWISLALVFNVLVFNFYDRMQPGSTYTNSEAGFAFLTGYLIEKSLSVDNIFVFVLIFTSFAVPAAYQHRVLFWGIIGALVMRAIMIFAGAALIKEFHWVIWIFGAFLIFTGVRMVLQRDHGHSDPSQHPVVKFFRRIIPVTENFEGEKFFTRRNGVLMATPLFLTLIMVELTDVVFAVDSIPAIFAVTQEPFIIYTSNVFAILGLRSLYFVLGGMVDQFRYLKLGLAGVLVFVGIKMLTPDVSALLGVPFKIPTPVSLSFILAALTISVVASIIANRRDRAAGIAVGKSVTDTH